MNEPRVQGTGMVKAKRLPFGLDLPGLMEWGYRVALALLVIASFYLNTVYARKDEVAVVVATLHAVEQKYVGFPERLDEARLELAKHEREDQEMQKSLTAIQNDLASVRATQRESMRNAESNFNRLFNKLDSLPNSPTPR